MADVAQEVLDMCVDYGVRLDALAAEVTLLQEHQEDHLNRALSDAIEKVKRRVNANPCDEFVQYKSTCCTVLDQFALLSGVCPYCDFPGHESG